MESDIKKVLEKQAQEELGGLNIYVGSGKKPKVFVAKPKDESGASMATQTLRNAAIGGAMAGGLPWAFLGLKPGEGERVKYFKAPKIVGSEAEVAAHQLSRWKINRVLRGLALGGAIVGAGSKLIPYAMKKIKKQAFESPQQVGKFVNQNTPSNLGASGKDLKALSTLPKRPIKEVLQKQAELELGGTHV
jgi:hypothetical protein